MQVPRSVQPFMGLHRTHRARMYLLAHTLGRIGVGRQLEVGVGVRMGIDVTFEAQVPAQAPHLATITA